MKKILTGLAFLSLLSSVEILADNVEFPPSGLTLCESSEHALNFKTVTIQKDLEEGYSIVTYYNEDGEQIRASLEDVRLSNDMLEVVYTARISFLDSNNEEDLFIRIPYNSFQQSAHYVDFRNLDESVRSDSFALRCH